MSNKEIALKVESVSKTFKLPTESTQSLRTTLVNYFRGIKGYKEQQVLKDISFEVEKGDFFGIVGRNGSGKSTLLKIISQIYVPEKGKVSVNGTLVPFIELGVGFNPELTGRENIYLNGALLGFTRSEIDAMYDDIVEFAELEEFMDQKLKNYSSGMQVRLAFSIAIKAEGDILVLDEVLAVGDEAFQRKCFEYFASLKKQKKTVILVTHDMASVQRFCTKAMMIDSGEISIIGDPNMVAGKYTLRNVEHRTDSKKVEGETVEKGEKRKNSIDVLSIRTKNSSKATDTFYLTDDILVEVKYKVNKAAVLLIKNRLRAGQKIHAFNSTINKEVRIFSHFEFVQKFFVFDADFERNPEYKAFISDVANYQKDGDNKHRKDAIDVLCSSANILKIKFKNLLY